MAYSSIADIKSTIEFGIRETLEAFPATPTPTPTQTPIPSPTPSPAPYPGTDQRIKSYAPGRLLGSVSSSVDSDNGTPPDIKSTIEFGQGDSGSFPCNTDTDTDSNPHRAQAAPYPDTSNRTNSHVDSSKSCSSTLVRLHGDGMPICLERGYGLAMSFR